MQSVDMWIVSNTKFFASEKMPLIKQELSKLPEDKLSLLYSLQFKDPTTIIILSALIGEFGVDRFMLGDVGLGIAKLLTLGGCFVWWIVDIFLVGNRTRELNFQLLMQTIGLYGK